MADALKENGYREKAAEASRDAACALAAIGLLLCVCTGAHADVTQEKGATADILFARAQVLERQGDLDGAIETYREALALAPDNVTTYVGLVDALCKKNDIEGALGAAREAIRHAPNHYMARVKLGEILLIKQDWRGAEEAFRKAIRSEPFGDLAYVDLGRVLAEKPFVEHPTISLLNEASRLLRESEENVDRAIAAYRKVIARDPNNAWAYQQLGNMLRKKGDSDGAIQAYRDAILLDPQKPELYANLGMALKDKGNLDGAVEAYREAIQLGRPNARYLNRLGLLLANQGDWSDVSKVARQAVQLEPENSSYHANLAEALGHTEQWTEAEVEAKRALILDPTRSSSGDIFVGFALGGQGKIQGALVSLDEVLRLRRDDTAAHFYRAWVLARADRKSEAVVAYRRALELMEKNHVPETSWFVRTATTAIEELK